MEQSESSPAHQYVRNKVTFTLPEELCPSCYVDELSTTVEVDAFNGTGGMNIASPTFGLDEIFLVGVLAKSGAKLAMRQAAKRGLTRQNMNLAAQAFRESFEEASFRSMSRAGSDFGGQITFGTINKLRKPFFQHKGDLYTSPWLTDKRVGVVSHLELFRGGGSFIVPESAYKKWIKGKDLVGRPDGQFITSKVAMDNILLGSKGSHSYVKKKLGIGRIIGMKTLSANSFFRWGGITVVVFLKSSLIKYRRAHSELFRQD